MKHTSDTTHPTINPSTAPAIQFVNCYPSYFSHFERPESTQFQLTPTTNLTTNATIQMITPFYPQFPLSNTTNIPENAAIQGTPTPYYGEYMYGYPLPPFAPRINANQYPSTTQGSIIATNPTSNNPLISFGSTSEAEAEGLQLTTQPDCIESETKSIEIEDVHDFGTQSNSYTEVDGSVAEPKLGMVFTSEEELFSYYKSYGKQCGFPIVTQRSKKTKDGKLRYVTLGCGRGGKARNRTLNVSRPRPTSKTGCKARINATYFDGVFKLLTVDNTHNHGLSPKKSRFFSCNREVSESVKRQLETNDQAGIRLNKSFAAIVQEAGGYEELPFTEKDCRNYVDTARQLRLGKGGAEALHGYFERMQCKNDGFFYSMELDDDLRLQNIFWADARSRAAYKYFGDVVTFDATYLTNRFEMPFTPFVGVNHHGQSILLGAALLSSEDTITYTWLFKTWLKCMGGVAPKAIITDQDRAMKKAIEEVFPNTRHRFCLWHILKKLPMKLGKKEPELNTNLLTCIYNSQTIDEFENRWEEIITTYNVEVDPWLKSLYSERTFWAPPFLKETFWAGMNTTQRSESMNAFFDGYVNSKTNLKEFVDQFDNALRRKIENEAQADFHSFNSKIPLVSPSPLEQVFQDLYTNSKFREVQKQILGMLGCLPHLVDNDGVIAKYRVEDEVRVDDFIKEVTNTVYFNTVEQEAKCSCGLFETRGILCRHQFAIFRINRVRSLPDKYILDRWRKDVKRTYTLISITYDVVEGRPEVIRYQRMMKVFAEVATNAASCDAHTEVVIDKLYRLNDAFSTTKPKQKTLTTVEMGTGSGSGSCKILTPLVKRSKGRPPTLRRKSLIEKVCKRTSRKATKNGRTNQPHGGDVQSLNTCRNLLSQIQESVPMQGGEPVFGTQESMQFGIDGTQPVNRDETQANNDMDHTHVF